MDSMSAFAMGMASKEKPLKVFDWDRAARVIKERGVAEAEAGLEGDWEWTGGDIWREGSIVPAEDTYVYLASTWATPLLMIEDETIECWRYQDDTPGWDSDTYWPQSAREIAADGAA